MSPAWVTALDHCATVWSMAMARACWQGGLSVALAWVISRLWTHIPAAARCWLWRLAYAKLLIALVWATPVDLALLPSPPRPTDRTPAVRTGTSPSPPDRASINTPYQQPVPALPPPGSAAGIMLLWLLGAAALSARFVRDWRKTRSYLAGCQPLDDVRIRLCSADLCARLRLHRPPLLLMAEDAPSPFLACAPRPAIVLPASLPTDFPGTKSEWMLAHELAHVKRRDLLWSWLPAAAQAIFWFHPPVWLAGSEWRLAQELACDELAVQVTRAAAADYGEMLLSLAAQPRAGFAGNLITAGVLESYHLLQRRLKAMETIRPISRGRMARIGSLLGVLGIVALVPWRVTAQVNDGGPTQPGAGRGEQESLLHLDLLGRALHMYSEDWSAELPPMKDAATAKKALYPYVRRNGRAFVDPVTDKPYQPNPSLSGKTDGGVIRENNLIRGSRPSKWARTKADIQRPSEIVAYYEPGSAPDGTRGVLFVDGQVARVSEAEWQRLKTVSGIP